MTESLPAALELAPHHRRELADAKALLERPRIGIQVVDLLGIPIERGFAHLPDQWQQRIHSITRGALEKAVDVALSTLDATQIRPASAWLHTLAATGAGAASGAMGLGALAVELPVTTTVMLRSIADIARAEGEDLSTTDARLACLAVFALGGRSANDDTTESSYYVARIGLANAVREAAQHLATKQIAKGATSPLLKFIQSVAARFSTQVSEKAAAQAVPIVGAAGGAILNWLFISHFQQMARGHFIIRRLERLYPSDLVEARYREIGGQP
jgi:EcsC protein family